MFGLLAGVDGNDDDDSWHFSVQRLGSDPS